MFRTASPVAWQHINFYGRYEFGKPSQPIDMAQMVQELAKRFSEYPSGRDFLGVGSNAAKVPNVS